MLYVKPSAQGQTGGVGEEVRMKDERLERGRERERERESERLLLIII